MQLHIVNGWQKVLHLFDTMSGGWVGGLQNNTLQNISPERAIALCNFFDEEFDQKNTELCRCFLVMKISMTIFNLKKSLRPTLITRNLILSQKYNLLGNPQMFRMNSKRFRKNSIKFQKNQNLSGKIPDIFRKISKKSHKNIYTKF